jgi:hypothetical protein
MLASIQKLVNPVTQLKQANLLAIPGDRTISSFVRRFPAGAHDFLWLSVLHKPRR